MIDGAKDRSSEVKQTNKFNVIVYILCKKSRAQHLWNRVLRQEGWLADQIQVKIEFLKLAVD